MLKSTKRIQRPGKLKWKVILSEKLRKSYSVWDYRINNFICTIIMEEREEFEK